MKALIIVDVQNDFCPGGALPVKEGDQIVPLINKIQKRFDLVVATQDWHPQNHKSFASNHPPKKAGEVIDLNGLPQVLWPDHCVQGSSGAAFHPDLNTEEISKIFKKGIDPEIDSYSGFNDNDHKKSTGLEKYLKRKGVMDVYIAGLATDYCVKFTALDARRLGFKAFVIIDACRGVNLKEGDVARSVEEMSLQGKGIIKSDQI